MAPKPRPITEPEPADTQARGEPADAPGKPRANALDGKTWTRYSISIWSDIRKSAEELALNHPAMFPVELPRRLIEMFMRPQDTTVFDPFMGVGSTLLAARQCAKKSIGIELSSEYCKVAETRLRQQGLFDRWDMRPAIHNSDARDSLLLVPPGSVDLVITSPPYWDILLEKRSADYKPTRDYGDTEHDLGKIREYESFLASLKSIFADVFWTLRPGGYCCVVVMDIRKKNRFYPYHSDIAAFMQEVGFVFDDIIIWDRRQEYNNMRPLGYPYVFRINKAHEYVLIFLRPER